MSPSSFSSAPIFLYFWFVGRSVFLPRHSVTLAMLPLDLCLLGLFWACHVLFSYSIYVAQCFCRVNLHTILGFLGPFHSFGYFQPVLFLWASLTHSILTFPWLLLCLLEFSSPITISFTFGVHWPLYQPHLLIHFFWAPLTHFCLLFIAYNSHGLTTFFFGLHWANLLSLGPFYYFIGPLTIIPAIQV